jgi:serine/threonine protein kinase
MAGKDCFDQQSFQAYLAGTLPAEQAERVSAHVKQCPQCRTAIDALSDGDTLVSLLRAPAARNEHQEEPECQAVIAQAKLLGAAPARPGAFDPYHRWLGIPPEEQPPHHYRLLGLKLWESDAEVIRDAADQRLAHVRTYQLGPSQAASQKILNELGAARACLLDPQKKAAYDEQLQRRLPPVPPAPPPPKTPPKNQLGEYELLAELGSGGMGTVYRARHTRLDKTVALKILAPGSLFDDEVVARFDREMKAVGRLNHPNIVQAHDAGEIGGTRFLVMEYVDGVSLSTLIDAGGPLPVAAACELIRQAAVGLDHAHRQGLVHRDIKPSNLMLDSHGQVKILDFGLAMFQPGQLAGVERITASGQAMGTIDYMAPEQAESSRTVDIRADLYSLGCTLYKLLSGHAPFSGPKYQDPLNKVMAHAREPVPPIRKVRPDVPAELAAVLDRLLAKDPAGRFAAPAELVEAIGPLAGGGDLRALLARARKSPTPSAGLEPRSRIALRPRSIAWRGWRSKDSLTPRMRLPGWVWAVAGGAAALILLAIILYTRTSHGPVKIEVPAPKAKVEVVRAPLEPKPKLGSATTEVAGRLPKGWVKIINRSTGRRLGARLHHHVVCWKFAAAGDSFKIRGQPSGMYLKVNDDSKDDGRGLSQVPNSETPSSLWKVESLGNGFWRIVNRNSGKCLESSLGEHGSINARQYALHEGAMSQQWWLESVSDADANQDGRGTDAVDAETPGAARGMPAK